MHSHDICLLLVTCLVASLRPIQAIRVEWGTNKGPIVPPTPRTTIPPRLPYREPAPVWEDQSNDIPNPNPYVYVLPPPSRPRTWEVPLGPYDNRFNQQPQRNPNYGSLITPQQAQGYYNGAAGGSVAALSPKYVPGVGYKYTAVVPKAQNGYYLSITDKLQGKYNAKTKKYKAYEKAKYTPLNYLRLFDADSQYVPQFNADELLGSQQLLPLDTKPLDWLATTTTTTTTTVTPKTTTTTTTTTTTKQPTTSKKHLIGNYKLAHEKSSFVKPLQSNKKKQQLELELELKLKQQKAQYTAQNSQHIASKTS